MAYNTVLDWAVFTAMVILAGCPTAGLAGLFAQSMGKDTATMAARQVTLSTLLCITTLPPIAVLAQMLAVK